MEWALFLSSGIKQRTSSRRGFSLLELAIVMGIMGLVLGTLWGAVSVVQDRVKRHQMQDQMLFMINNIRNFYAAKDRIEDEAGNVTYSEVTDFLLRRNVLLPEQIRNRAAPAPWVADTPWGAAAADGSLLAGGGIEVGGFDRFGVVDAENFFTIRLSGLSYANCLELAATLSANSVQDRLEAVLVNGVAQDPPVPVNFAATNCVVAPAGTANRLAFVYFLRRSVL